MQNKKLKLQLLRISILGAVVLLLLHFYPLNFNLNQSSVRAIGNLEVDWGVPDGEPIFVIENILPGEMAARTVDVVNNAGSIRPVGVRAVKTSGDGVLETGLEITISQNSSDIYGGTAGLKTVAQFFAESAGPDGIPLSSLNAGESTTYTFKVVFPQIAGNEFQGKDVIFDLIIGISIDLPSECDQIDLLPTPIIGTSKAETLTGTPGNDLIMGLEGADKINGNLGDDCILGGTGADSVNGNNGNDAIFGQEHADTINGNNGADFIVGGTGADTLKGQEGNDHLIGNEQADTLDGGNDNDILEGNDAPDTLKGGNGDDSLIGGFGVDTANGNNGTDSCDAETETNCEI